MSMTEGVGIRNSFPCLWVQQKFKFRPGERARMQGSDKAAAQLPERAWSARQQQGQCSEWVGLSEDIVGLDPKKARKEGSWLQEADLVSVVSLQKGFHKPNPHLKESLLETMPQYTRSMCRRRGDAKGWVTHYSFSGHYWCPFSRFWSLFHFIWPLFLLLFANPFFPPAYKTTVTKPVKCIATRPSVLQCSSHIILRHFLILKILHRKSLEWWRRPIASNQSQSAAVEELAKSGRGQIMS